MNPQRSPGMGSDAGEDEEEEEENMSQRNRQGTTVSRIQRIDGDGNIGDSTSEEMIIIEEDEEEEDTQSLQYATNDQGEQIARGNNYDEQTQIMQMNPDQFDIGQGDNRAPKNQTTVSQVQKFEDLGKEEEEEYEYIYEEEEEEEDDPAQIEQQEQIVLPQNVAITNPQPISNSPPEVTQIQAFSPAESSKSATKVQNMAQLPASTVSKPEFIEEPVQPFEPIESAPVKKFDVASVSSKEGKSIKSEDKIKPFEL